MNRRPRSLGNPAGSPWLLAAIAGILLCATTVSGAAGTDLSRPGAGGPPTPVRVTLYLVNLAEVSGGDQTFLADVVLQAEWEDSRLADTGSGPRGLDLDDIWNPRLQLVNQRGVSAMLPQRVEVDPSGRVRYRQRWWGRFSTRMDLKDFPMDRQRFAIEVASLGHSRDEVELTPDPERSGRASSLSITDWDVGEARAEFADFTPAPSVKPLAGVRLAWEGRRYVAYYTVQVILPLVMIVIMGWAALWVEASVVATRMSVAVTTMLTLIAYRFALGRLVPNLTYLTRFDWFMLGSTILIFLTLLVVTLGAHLVGTDRRPLAVRIDQWSRMAFLAAFAAILLWSWWR